MKTTRRGFQGKRYRVYDLETESYRDYSVDEFQCVLWLSEKQQTEEANARTIRNEQAVPTVQFDNVLGPAG